MCLSGSSGQARKVKYSPQPPIHDVVRLRDRTWTLITNALEFDTHVCDVTAQADL